jgi:hypothetical protein
VALYPSFNGKNQLNYGTFHLLDINFIQYKFIYFFLTSTHNIDLCHWTYYYHPNDINFPDLVSCSFVCVPIFFIN